MPFAGYYAGKNVLVTGDTGFKGSWLAWWLVRLGARVTGLALPPDQERGPFRRGRLDESIRHVDGDIREEGILENALAESKPAAVFHLAAQALVRESYSDPLGTFDTNVMGTARLLEAVRKRGQPCVVVVVTSDKCYENVERAHSYREGDPLGGRDPYSASKGAAELVVAAYRRSFFDLAAPDNPGVALASARAGNVLGPGDWARDRIVPDLMRALLAGQSVEVRNPDAVRPWQHVLEPLAGYLWLGARLASENAANAASAWNFGPNPESARTVRDLVERFLAAWGTGEWRSLKHASDPHEAHFLQLDIGKAARELNWRPAWDFETAVRRTAQGYRDMKDAASSAAGIRGIMDREIENYTTDARSLGLPWATDNR